MQRPGAGLTFKIGNTIILIELIVLAVVGAVYVTRFSDQVDRRIEAQARLPAVLMNAGMLAFDAVMDADTMQLLVGEKLMTAMVVGTNSNVFYSLAPEYLGRSVTDVPDVDVGLLNATDPREVIVRKPDSAIVVAPIFGVDRRTVRFFVYIEVKTTAAASEKGGIVLLFALGSVAAVVMTSLALLFSFHRMIFVRLADLSRVLSRVEAGDLTVRVAKATSRDEIGALQRRANAMIAGRRQAEERIIRLNRVLRAIRNVNQLITQERNLDRLLEHACECLIETDGYVSAWILLPNEDGTSPKFVWRDMAEHAVSLADLLDQGGSIACAQTALNREEVQIINAADGGCRGCILSRSRDHNVMVVRLEYDSKIYGVLGVCVLADSLIDSEELSLFAEVAGDIAFALHGIALGEERDKAKGEREALRVQMMQGQRLESIGILAGGVAHEINNPINGIMNYAQLIQDKMDPGSREHEFASEILVETERVATIVRDLLTFARQDREAHSPARIADIVSGVTSLIQTVIRRDQIALEVDVPEDLPKLKCRSQQIQQVIMNLLTNARDALNQRYTEYDENKIIRIRARTFENEGRRWIRTTVEDHGTGVSEAVRERMFNPFFTTKDRSKGTGLGLSISHGIVEDHHGEISVESEPGEYTRFYIDLPVDNGWELEER